MNERLEKKYNVVVITLLVLLVVSVAVNSCLALSTRNELRATQKAIATIQQETPDATNTEEDDIELPPVPDEVINMIKAATVDTVDFDEFLTEVGATNVKLNRKVVGMLDPKDKHTSVYYTLRFNVDDSQCKIETDVWTTPEHNEQHRSSKIVVYHDNKVYQCNSDGIVPDMVMSKDGNFLCAQDVFQVLTSYLGALHESKECLFENSNVRHYVISETRASTWHNKDCSKN